MHDKEAATSKRPVYRNFIRAYCKKSNTVFAGRSLPVDGVTCKFSQGKFNRRNTRRWGKLPRTRRAERSGTSPLLDWRICQAYLAFRSVVCLEERKDALGTRLPEEYKPNCLGCIKQIAYWVYFWWKYKTKQTSFISVIFKQTFLHYFLFSQAFTKVGILWNWKDRRFHWPLLNSGRESNLALKAFLHQKLHCVVERACYWRRFYLYQEPFSYLQNAIENTANRNKESAVYTSVPRREGWSVYSTQALLCSRSTVICMGFQIILRAIWQKISKFFRNKF